MGAALVTGVKTSPVFEISRACYDPVTLPRMDAVISNSIFQFNFLRGVRCRASLCLSLSKPVNGLSLSSIGFLVGRQSIGSAPYTFGTSN